MNTPDSTLSFSCRVFLRLCGVAWLAVMGLSLHQPASAGEEDPPHHARTKSISLFGGVMTSNRWYDTFAPWNLEFRSSVMVGLAASHRVGPLDPRWSFEVEGQVVRHFGEQDNWEFNLPVVARWDAFSWDNTLDTSLAFGVGPSYTSSTPEAEVAIRGNSHRLMVYWKLEAEFAPPGEPWSAIVVLHHRSGAFNTVANEGGSNSIVIGIRRRF